MGLIAADLNAGVILVVTVQRYTYHTYLYTNSFFPHLHSPVPNKPYGFCGRKAPGKKKVWTKLRSIVKVEVDVLGSPSLIVLRISVDVKQH